MKLSRIGLPDVKSLVMVVAGNFLYALMVKLFLLPANLAIGGTNGIAMMIDHFFGISISGFVLVFNVIMLLIGLVVLGKGFAVTTLASTFAYPFFLHNIYFKSVFSSNT